MAAEADQKVVVHVRSTGDAPVLKQAKFKISGREKILKVIEFLRRQFHQDTLFVYVNSAFSPNPDELVIDLYNNFAIDGKLVVNYACGVKRLDLLERIRMDQKGCGKFCRDCCKALEL